MPATRSSESCCTDSLDIASRLAQHFRALCKVIAATSGPAFYVLKYCVWLFFVANKFDNPWVLAITLINIAASVRITAYTRYKNMLLKNGGALTRDERNWFKLQDLNNKIYYKLFHGRPLDDKIKQDILNMLRIAELLDELPSDVLQYLEEQTQSDSPAVTSVTSDTQPVRCNRFVRGLESSLIVGLYISLPLHGFYNCIPSAYMGTMNLGKVGAAFLHVFSDKYNDTIDTSRMSSTLIFLNSFALVQIIAAMDAYLSYSVKMTLNETIPAIRQGEFRKVPKWVWALAIPYNLTVIAGCIALANRASAETIKEYLLQHIFEACAMDNGNSTLPETWCNNEFGKTIYVTAGTVGTVSFLFTSTLWMIHNAIKNPMTKIFYNTNNSRCGKFTKIADYLNVLIDAEYAIMAAHLGFMAIVCAMFDADTAVASLYFKIPTLLVGLCGGFFSFVQDRQAIHNKKNEQKIVWLSKFFVEQNLTSTPTSVIPRDLSAHEILSVTNMDQHSSPFEVPNITDSHTAALLVTPAFSQNRHTTFHAAKQAYDKPEERTPSCWDRICCRLFRKK